MFVLYLTKKNQATDLIKNHLLCMHIKQLQFIPAEPQKRENPCEERVEKKS